MWGCASLIFLLYTKIKIKMVKIIIRPPSCSSPSSPITTIFVLLLCPKKLYSFFFSLSVFLPFYPSKVSIFFLITTSLFSVFSLTLVSSHSFVPSFVFSLSKVQSLSVGSDCIGVSTSCTRH